MSLQKEKIFTFSPTLLLTKLFILWYNCMDVNEGGNLIGKIY